MTEKNESELISGFQLIYADTDNKRAFLAKIISMFHWTRVHTHVNRFWEKISGLNPFITHTKPAKYKRKCSRHFKESLVVKRE